jgi:hypothetical protein
VTPNRDIPTAGWRLIIALRETRAILLSQPEKTPMEQDRDQTLSDLRWEERNGARPGSKEALMKRHLLSAVAVLALIAGSASVQAQDAQQPMQAQQPTQEVCPPEQCPPQGGNAEAPAVAPEQGQPVEEMQPPDGGQAAQQPMEEEQPADSGQAAQQPTEEQPAESGQAAQQPVEEGQPTKERAGKKPLPEDQQQAAQPGDEQQPGEEPTETGSVKPSVEIDDEQATEIRTAVRDIDIDPVDVDFEINIGVAVPQTVVLHPLPPRIIEIVPAYADYEFFILADGTIVIVDPGSFRVVYVLVA